jgi:hypothetical protein
MAFTTAVRLAVLLAVLAVPADALAASTLRTSSVTGRMVVPDGRSSTIRLHCPPGAVALNGAIARQGGGVIVRRSIPGGDGDAWAFRVAAGGAGSRAVSAVLRCVSLRLPTGFTHSRLDVRTRSAGGVDLAPGETVSARLGCGNRWTATGYAVDGGRNGDVRLAEVVPGAHGWRFTLENTGSAAAVAGVSAHCLRSKARATGPGGAAAELRFNVTRPSFHTTFPRGGPQIEASGCRTGRFSLAAGGSLDPASTIELLIASPIRERGGRWRFGRPSAGDEFTGYTVCLSRRSRFH